MKKKTYLSAVITLSLLGTGALIAGCAGSVPSYVFDDYERNLGEKNYQTDRALLDGKFDEEIWTGAAWHSMTSNPANRYGENANLPGFENDVTYQATVVTDEKGLYVGVKSEDTVLYSGLKWDDFNRNTYQVPTRAFGKTGVSVYVADERKKTESNPGIAEIGFSVDGQISGYYTTVNGVQMKLGTVGMYSGVDTKGAELNSKNAQGYGVEAFIPWSALPFIDGEDVPEEVMSTFASHRYADFNLEEQTRTATRCWEMLDAEFGHGWMTPSSWLKYGKTGQVLQAQGEVFGMWDDRLEYDEAFRLDGDVAGEDREVTFAAATDPSKRREARLYVRDIKDTVLFAEAKFTVDKEALEETQNNGDQYPMVGLAFYGDRTTVEGVTARCTLNMGVTLNLQESNHFNSLYWADPVNGEDFTGKRNFNTNTPFDPTREEGFTLTAFRDGETFYLFCNDALYATVEVPYITAETEAYMGLTVLNLPVKITDYTFSCGEQAIADFGTRLSQSASVTAGEGVTVTGIEAGKTYRYKEEITLNVTADNSHVLTKVLLNGEIIHLTGGTYTFVYYGGPLNLELISVGKSKKVVLGDTTGATVAVTDNADLQKEYESGDAVTFTVSPESDYYEIVAVKVNGETVTAENGKYSCAFPSDGFFIITIETNRVKVDVTPTLKYEDGAAIDASKVSLQGAQITLTNKADANDTHTVTVEASNAVPEIKGLKIGATYGVTTTAMNGKLKVKDFVCDGTATKLQLQLANNIAGNGSYKAELGTDFAVSGITGNRPVGNLLMTGLNLEGEVWFGATVRLSGAGSSLRYGSMIAIYFGAPGHNWIEIGHPDGVSGATDHNGGVRYYNGKSYSSNSYIMTAEENALLKNNGLRVAICRTTEGNLEVYFVIDGAMKKVVTFENAVTDAITSFGVRLNTIYTGSNEAEKGWIRNLDYASSAKELLGNLLGTAVEIKVNNSTTDDTASVVISGNPSEYEVGKTYTFTVTPKSGYKVNSVTVNGEQATAMDGEYSFVFYGKTEIEVKTAEKGKVTLGTHTGTIVEVADNADLQKTYESGDVVTFTVVPESDYYEIVAVKVNGETVTAENGKYSMTFGESEKFEITVETKVVQADVTITLGYEDGAAIDASKVSLQGATFTLTKADEESVNYTVTVGENNAIAQITGMKTGTYRVTTTAMNGNLKVKEFVCDGTATKLQLQLANNIAGNGSYKAELGTDFAVSGITGNRPVGNLLMTGLNLEGEVWFGATVRLSGAGSSLRYGSMIAIYFGAPGHNWIEIGHPDGVSGATDHNGGVRYYNGKSYSSNSYIMTAEENALLKNNGLRVAICRTTEGNLEVYFVIDGALQKVITYDNAITNPITSFGVRLNTIYTGSEESEKGWIRNLDYATSVKELLGSTLGTVEIKVNNSTTDDTAAVAITGNPSAYEVGKTYTFTVTPKNGYKVSSVTVNGDQATATDGEYSFVFYGKTEIEVKTAEKGKVTLGTHTGTIVEVADNADLQKTYESGDVVTFTVVPESDYYEIVAVKVNGTTVTGTDGTYSQVYGDSNLFEITVETKVVKSDVTFALGYNDGAAIDASKVSLQGAQITLTNKVDKSDTHTVTVEASNAVPEIKGLKVGATYGVTTTAMNGKLKGADFVCDGNAATLKLQFTNGINYANGSCIAELGSDFAVNSIAGNRPVGNLLLTGLNLEGEVWFGATVRLSGAGSSLRYGSMIAIYFGAPGHNWIEIGHPDGVSGATDHNGGVRYYNGKSYSSNSYIMTAEENALLKNNGLRVAICRTTEGNLEVYFVIDGAMKKVVTFENAVTDAITSFGARLNTIYTGSEESEKGWNRNLDYATSAKELLGDALETK